ncbi:hypothetical protein LXL04_030223 [Taraxacum kok-saghyz]
MSINWQPPDHEAHATSSHAQVMDRYSRYAYVQNAQTVDTFADLFIMALGFLFNKLSTTPTLSHHHPPPSTTTTTISFPMNRELQIDVLEGKSMSLEDKSRSSSGGGFDVNVPDPPTHPEGQFEPKGFPGRTSPHKGLARRIYPSIEDYSAPPHPMWVIKPNTSRMPRLEPWTSHWETRAFTGRLCDHLLKTSSPRHSKNHFQLEVFSLSTTAYAKG